MTIKVNENTYTQLIEEDIKELEKYMPNTLERKHIIEVLKKSIKLEYKNSGKN